MLERLFWTVMAASLLNLSTLASLPALATVAGPISTSTISDLSLTSPANLGSGVPPDIICKKFPWLCK